VHTTTAGMELPLLGIPSIVVSKTHFRGRGFTIDLNSKDAYFDYLSQFKKENVETERSKILAERYAFLLFERYQVPFEVFNLDEKRGVNFWRFNSISELFKIDYFEDIIDSIIKRKAFLTEA
jgi:hypothetical protein